MALQRSIRRVVIGCVLVYLAFVVVGRVRANLSDMEAKIADLEIPAAYERRGTRSEGGKLALFGVRPKLTQAYVSPDDLETTCETLRDHLTGRSPTLVRHDNACHFQFQMRPGFWAMAQLNLSYDLTVTALRDKDGAPFTWVHAYVTDRGI